MESTNKLRGYIRAFVTGSMETDLTDFADEIEREIAELESSYKSAIDEMHDNFMRAEEDLKREIAERYMLLPVDADGVPIHPRDEVDTSMGEKGPVGHLEYWYPDHWVAVIEYKPGQFTRYDTAAIYHVKPRTIEDVLKAFFHDALDADAFCTVRLDDVLAKYADELCNMGVSE